MIKNSWFWIGLSIRLILILFLTPTIQSEWFTPFLLNTIETVSINPWSDFLASDGYQHSFPYGISMIVAFLPLGVLGWITDLFLATESYIFGLGLGITVLIFDFLCLVTIQKIVTEYRDKILIAYWLSPLVIYITYWHGQLDIIPVMLMMAAFQQAGEKNFTISGLLLAIACSAKLSMFLVVPFFIIYLWQNRRLRSQIGKFLLSFSIVVIILILIPSFSLGYRDMVLGTPEASRLFWLSVRQSDQLYIFIVPLLFGFIVYGMWRLRRTNFQLLIMSSGVAFLAMVLIMPPTPGWYLWAIPFLVIYQISTDKAGWWLVMAFSILTVILLIQVSSGPVLNFLEINLTLIGPILSSKFLALLLTMIIGLGSILAIRMFREGVQRNDYFRLSRHPLAVGISGDSGAGKDTLSMALEDLFGKASVQHILGDNYHKWPRNSKMWRSVTHLHPRANDLARLTDDVYSFLDGRGTEGQFYDHKTGRFTSSMKIKSNDILLVSGLHALLPVALVERLDVKIFLETDDKLRAYWKTRRDIGNRGYEESKVNKQILERSEDSKLFIKPQQKSADIVFKVSAVNPDQLFNNFSDQDTSNIPLKLEVIIRNGLYTERLSRALIAICGVHLEQEILEDNMNIKLMIEGDIWPEDLSLVANDLLPHLDELLNVTPNWYGDVLGLMQLIALMQINENLRRKLVI